MKKILELKRNIVKEGILIIKEKKGEYLSEIYLDKIPGKKKNSNGQRRTECYSFNPFFIKNYDAKKLTNKDLPPLEEINLEVKNFFDFKKYGDKEIFLVEKIAILHINQKVYLVEIELNISLNDSQKKEMEKLIEIAKERYNGDIKPENIGFNSHNSRLEFFDSFLTLK